MCIVFIIVSNMVECVYDYGLFISKWRKIDLCLFLSFVLLIILDDLLIVIFIFCLFKFMLLLYKVMLFNVVSFVFFSKVFCELENLDRGFILGDVFRWGINIVIDFFYGNIFEVKYEKIILEKFVKILKLGGRLVGYFLFLVLGLKVKVEI